MNQRGLGDQWSVAFGEAASALAGWREGHPLATFNDIEDARDRFLQPVLRQMTTELAEGSEPEVGRVRCPQCEGVLRSEGRRTRELLGEGGQRFRLERDYKRCTACGWAGFPPR